MRDVRGGVRSRAPFVRAAAGLYLATATGMNRHAQLADFYLAGCAVLPLPLLFAFGPLAELGALVPFLLLGCYHGALEQIETGSGPLADERLGAAERARSARTPR